MPGKYTRLLSSAGPDHLMNEVPTWVSPQYDFSKDSYVAYNKPLSITHWLQNAKPEEDVVWKGHCVGSG